MRLQGKVAFITGAASGIGRAAATIFAREGARVAVCDLNAQGTGEVVEEIRRAGGQALAVPADVTSSAQINEAVRKTAEALGAVDILASVAGWEKTMPFVDTTEDLWDQLIAINLKGHMICTRAVLDPMIERRSGKLVYVSSDAGRVGSTGEAVYSGAKGGVIAFAKTIAREMARYSINANVICPGPTDTPLLRSLSAERPKLYEAMEKAVPFRRFARPEEIAHGLLFFASDESSYITGQVLSISGGLTMC